MSIFRQLLKLSVTLEILVSDYVNFCAAGLRSRTALAAENLFLRKQLALFQEREKKAVPTTVADRFVLSNLARFFDWRSALVIVKPATLIAWHRAAFRRWISQIQREKGSGRFPKQGCLGAQIPVLRNNVIGQLRLPLPSDTRDAGHRGSVWRSHADATMVEQLA